MLPATHSRGFTLIELMVVLVVISVMLGLATVSLDTNPAKELQREGRRLQAVLQMAADEAVIVTQLIRMRRENRYDTGYQQQCRDGARQQAGVF